MGLLRTAISGRVLRTSHSLVVHALGRAIVNGDLPVGGTLPGDVELAERFQVSRTVLREAMKTLHAKGLIVARARIGTRVTERSSWNLFDADILAWHFEAGVDAEFLRHLSDMRLAIEPAAARLAAGAVTAEEGRHLIQVADGMSGDHDPESFALADLDFHRAVLEASRNPFMHSVGSVIEAALYGAFKLSSPAEDAEMTESSAALHRRIAEAIAAHDPEAASAAMEAVIIEGLERVAARAPAG